MTESEPNPYDVVVHRDAAASPSADPEALAAAATALLARSNDRHSGYDAFLAEFNMDRFAQLLDGLIATLTDRPYHTTARLLEVSACGRGSRSVRVDRREPGCVTVWFRRMSGACVTRSSRPSDAPAPCV